MARRAAGTPGVAGVGRDAWAGDLVRLSATLTDPPDSAAAFRTVERLRAHVDVPGTRTLVGGNAAVNLDARTAAVRDRRVVVPLVLLVVVVVLALLLRAVVAPVLLVATVVVSFLAALGTSALVYQHLFGFRAVDVALPLFGFIFLVALGIDYNIFLMSRVREEADRIGPRPGTLRGLAVTGGVITSAGLVLAATFSVLLLLPLVPLVQVGFLVAFGVLLDTFVVRSVLVPALVLDVGPAVWWPSALSRRGPGRPGLPGRRDAREPVGR
ncbi:MAG TPA: MMPL family transporter [Frankiaceae bacterium]|nr:MMPL family transporter [Frankiaceae bacterium]